MANPTNAARAAHASAVFRDLRGMAVRLHEFQAAGGTMYLRKNGPTEMQLVLRYPGRQSVVLKIPYVEFPDGDGVKELEDA